MWPGKALTSLAPVAADEGPARRGPVRENQGARWVRHALGILDRGDAPSGIAIKRRNGQRGGAPRIAPPTLSKVGHDRLPAQLPARARVEPHELERSEEHTSELQSRENLVCRLLLEKK